MQDKCDKFHSAAGVSLLRVSLSEENESDEER